MQFINLRFIFLSNEKKGEVGISELGNLRAQHEFLCSALENISNAFQLVIFISTAFYIFEVTFSIYATLQVIISSLRDWNIQRIVIGVTANFSWALLLVYNFSQLAWQCEQLAIEVYY
jgi:hypothetical protein